MRFTFSGLLVLTGLTAGLVVDARADGNPATDDVVNLFPYTGTLERDGQGVSEAVEMEFALYDAALGVSGTPVWVETQQVEVYGGRFTALLGLCDQDPSVRDSCPLGGVNADLIDEIIRNADDLSLGIRLFPSSAAVVLQQRKRFVPVPYAIWTRAATDLEVARDLTVRRNAGVTGNASIGGNATVGGALNVTGTIRGSGLDTSCPGTRAHGMCWWIKGGYQYTHQQAAQACAADGAHLCSLAELSALHSAGAQQCSFAWSADRTDPTHAYMTILMQVNDANCRPPGVNPDLRAMTDLFSAQCCKP